MAQLSLQAGLAAGRGARIIEQGFKAGALGTGAEAARHQCARSRPACARPAPKNQIGEEGQKAARTRAAGLRPPATTWHRAHREGHAKGGLKHP